MKSKEKKQDLGLVESPTGDNYKHLEIGLARGGSLGDEVKRETHCAF